MFTRAGDIQYFSFDSFSNQPIIHGFFMRHGGVSPIPWKSLNTAQTVGDSRENIIENRRRIFHTIHRPVESLYDVWQVHSSDVICTDTPRPLETPHLKADAIATNRLNVTLFMRFADCVPIMLYDPSHHAVSLVHAGWKGTVNKIVKNAVETLQVHYQSNPAEILAGIGPSIGPDHYEIGPDVVEQVELSFANEAARLLHTVNGHVHLDLWQSNAFTLLQAGVKKIEIAGICTGCHKEDWFSHRVENGKTGRFGAILALSNIVG
jgi:polyphenol oxidase